MSIIGLWKVSEVNAFDKNFKQSWRTVEDIAADPAVNPMQKAFSQAAYKFEEDGTLYSLMPKALVPAGEGEPYDDDYVIAKKTRWKEENGTFFAAAEDDGELDWQKMSPTDNGFEIFGYQRIVKA